MPILRFEQFAVKKTELGVQPGLTRVDRTRRRCRGRRPSERQGPGLPLVHDVQENSHQTRAPLPGTRVHRPLLRFGTL
jgi:hypothetical protein